MRLNPGPSEGIPVHAMLLLRCREMRAPSAPSYAIDRGLSNKEDSLDVPHESYLCHRPASNIEMLMALKRNFVVSLVPDSFQDKLYITLARGSRNCFHFTYQTKLMIGLVLSLSGGC